MAKAVYVGVGSKARKMKKAYIGIGGKARKVKKMYIGDSSGKARLCYSAELEKVGMAHKADAWPITLSGGQKQRVAIATALVSERKILVLDEPTSGLDLQHMKEVADELVAIQKMGKTSLVITHDYELIVSCCTHVLHLEHGMVQEQYALDAAGLQRLQNFFIESR